jgi:hypothetical protein
MLLIALEPEKMLDNCSASDRTGGVAETIQSPGSSPNCFSRSNRHDRASTMESQPGVALAP